MSTMIPWVAQMVKSMPGFDPPGQEDPLEEEIATHSSILI